MFLSRLSVILIIIDFCNVFLEKKSFSKCITYENGNIRTVISTIENGGLRIALIINKREQLVGTVCDGDIRRGLLRGLNLDSPISTIIKKIVLLQKLIHQRKKYLK